jgi:hypothetical protein
MKKFYQIALVLSMAMIVGCAGNDEAFQKQLAEDAKIYADMKCELIKQLRVIEADTSITDHGRIADSLKAIWKEKAAELQKKYDTPEHKDLFKEKAKEFQMQMEGCKPMGEEQGKVKKRKEKKEKKGKE